ncbi:MAG: class I SAM-dependent rRNA methyltransferase [Bacteroidia bacterium]|nr:class I SAM-dependent rRNA methyltransferase [Bacteroidia bacterium]
MNFLKVILNSGKESSLLRFHPWVFSGAIKRIINEAGQATQPEEGQIVSVYSSTNQFLALGHYQIGSISVRCFSFNNEPITTQFWKNKIKSAYQLRQQLNLVNNASTNTYRLVNGEGDGLPGLIIDFYNGVAILQTHSIGMHLIKDTLVEGLQDLYGNELKAVYDKSDETMPKQAKIKADNKWWINEIHHTEVIENNCKFKIDWVNGQKTGFFIDQRDNRELLAKYAKDKTVLNTFCYSGGFSIYALKAGAKEVHSVDSSKKAIDLTNENVQLNFGNSCFNHQAFAVDTFTFLKEKENIYDLVILDPPAFAKHQNVKHNAVKGYKRLNYEAIKLIKSGGILFTFSCSQVIDKQLFNSTVMAAAIMAGRKVSILHQLHQPADHAINIYHPENEYLKGLVLHIE